MLEKTSLFAESWNVAWRECSQGTILQEVECPFHIINNSFRYWAADPFIFEYQGRTYIFAELYDYIRRKGGIGFCELEEGKTTRWTQVIKEDYHLSYPFIFEYNHEIYIIPESGTSNMLQLYRAVEFPKKWEKIKILRESVNFADTTPFRWKTKELAITYKVKPEESYELWLLDLEERVNDKLLLIDNLEVRRPAGKVFNLEDKNIRPAQNCTNDYGEGLIFYEYNISKDENYTEKELKRVFPKELNFSKKLLLDGMHTYNGNKKYEIIDIKTRRFNVLNFIFRIIGKMSV